MDPARDESCPSGQRRGPAALGEDRVSSPDYKSFHISKTPITRGRKRRSPGSIPLPTVWRPQPHWLVDWLGHMEPARGESCPSRQRRGPAAPEEIGYHPRIRNPSISLQIQQPGDENGDPPGRYRPARFGIPNSTGWLLIGWGSWSQRAARVAPLSNVEVPPHPGRIGSYPRIRNPSIYLQLQQPGGENEDPPGRYCPARCGNPNHTG